MTYYGLTSVLKCCTSLIICWIVSTIAHLSTKTDYMFLSDCGQQVFWICQLLDELEYKLGPIPICRNNQGFIFMTSNPVTEQHSKPINIQWHMIPDWIKDDHIKLFFINSISNPADIFTKNLGHIMIQYILSYLMHFSLISSHQTYLSSIQSIMISLLSYCMHFF